MSKPVVYPVIIDGEPAPKARAVQCESPSMPPGTEMWVLDGDRWIKVVVLEHLSSVIKVKRVS